MTDRSGAGRMRALQARYELQARDGQRLMNLLAGSAVKPGSGVTIGEIFAGLPPAQFTEAMELRARLRRTAGQLGLDWPGAPRSAAP